MIVGLGIALLYVLTRINIKLDNPLIPAAVYAVIPLIFGLIIGHETNLILLNSLVNLIFGAIFFFILKALEDNPVVWTTSIILGLLIRVAVKLLII